MLKVGANEGEALTAAATGGAAFQPMKVADVPESVLETNGTLKRNTLFFGCTATNCQKPTDAITGKFAVRMKDRKDAGFSKRDKYSFGSDNGESHGGEPPSDSPSDSDSELEIIANLAKRKAPSDSPNYDDSDSSDDDE